MTEPFRIRRAAAADSRRCFDVFLASARDLTARQNVAWDPEPESHWAKMRYLLDHLAAHHAEWWIAEDPATGDALGYARSVERSGLFELSEFFVHPDRQAAGVGAALLDRAFPPDRGEVRAIIATTDLRAQARYYRSGCVARFPIAGMVGPPRRVEPEPHLDAVRLVAGGPELETVRDVERQVLEFERGDELDWLAGIREGYLYRRDGKAIGFAFVGPGGTGPIAALDPGDQVAILGHVEARAAELGIEELSLEVPMVNDVAVRHLLDRGFRFDPFYTFLMSSRPFGRFDRFIGFSPPWVL
ncbi:MAG TPA: GNAT family N-acetyltransferase [Candidatus Limnocylindria bacterium]|nr:GNAT family N-acetyltransferase [Candidatus Limnocylindria bacterium]